MALAAWLWVHRDSGPVVRWLVRAVTAGVLLVAVIFQAGQPLTRSWQDIVRGDTSQPLLACDIPRLGLRIEREHCGTYRRLLALIAEHSALDAPILALPVNPELYFLAERLPPVRFFSAALGVRNDSQLTAALQALEARPPALVIHDPHDKYNSPHTERLMAWVAERYEPLAVVDAFHVYQYAGDVRRSATAAIPGLR